MKTINLLQGRKSDGDSFEEKNEHKSADAKVRSAAGLTLDVSKLAQTRILTGQDAVVRQQHTVNTPNNEAKNKKRVQFIFEETQENDESQTATVLSECLNGG